ncbi:MAG: carboxypeptidase regulatory-like domain-containing protein [Gemmatimonadaceae bacterium]
MRLFSLLALLVVSAFAPAIARAQVGSTTDIITGRVVGPDSVPLVGAKVDVISAETQVTRSTRTNDRGRYTVVFPDGGGQYGVTITYVGFAPSRIVVQRNADEDRLVADAQLSVNPTTLSEVTVRGRRPTAGQRTEAGGTERGLPPAITNRLPVDPGDLAALATLVPGVLPVAGTDTTPNSFAIAGQPPNQNSITLDGLTFGAGAIPSDAVRSTRVITNTYDVARGQFTGGQVASTTRGGTNNLAGTITYVNRDPSLEFSNVRGAFSNEFEQNQLSFGLGGPLVKDRAFLFASGQLARRSSGLPSLLSADRTSLTQLGASSDSIARFLGVLGGKGLPAGFDEDRVTDNASAIVRGDVTLNEAHSLTMRLDWRGSRQSNARVSTLAVPGTGGNANSSGGGAMLTATSRLEQFINEARIYGSVDNRTSDPYQSLPAGRVVVASTLEDGSNAVSTLQFGGNSSLPQSTRTTMLEASDELSWVSPEAAHRVKLGGLLTVDRTRQGSFANQFGTFTFNSLEDFANDQPVSFTRTLSSHTRESGAITGAAYLGDGWRVSDALQLTLGARAEGTRYPTRPAYNPAIDAAFGRRTDDVPSELRLSPRAGFTWQVGRGENAPPLVILRGGIGEFRSRAPSQLVAGALDATGLGTGQSQIVCIGSQVPVPDWNAYRNDPSTIPADCGVAGAIGSRRNVTVFDPGFEAPRAWRGSLGLTRRIHDLFALSVDATYARGVAQTGLVDLNLRDTPRFFLAGESGRPVYVRSDSVVPTTGQTSILASRRVAGFGAVDELQSRLQSDTRQLTVSLGGFGLRGATFNTGYTWSRSRDQGSGFAQGFFGGGSTAGDPNQTEWGRSDRDIRNQLFAQVLYPLTTSLDASLVARANSGAPYSPLVAGDINGDGSRNDRAFIYDPASAPDTALRNGMTRLLASTSGTARACLESQLGSIAGRNSCVSPWTGALDVQLNWRPVSFGLNRRLTISLQMLNALTGLDQLVHGPNDMRGWGQQGFTDRTLLYVRGFDPTPGAERYIYQVNEHFGSNSNRGRASAPFQIGLTGRYQIGIDDSRRAMFNVLGGANGQPLGADSLKARMRRGITNPFYRIIALNDSLQLALTPDQQSRLKSFGDTLQSKIDPAIDEIAASIAKQGKNADPQALRVTLGRRLGEARSLVQQAAKDAQATLTAEQWAKLPADVKTPGMRRGGQGGPGGGDRPRGDREP